MQKGVDILYYLYKTKQWIIDLKIVGEFTKVVTENEELYILDSKIVRCNNMIGRSLYNYLAKQMETFEKEEKVNLIGQAN